MHDAYGDQTDKFSKKKKMESSWINGKKYTTLTIPTTNNEHM